MIKTLQKWLIEPSDKIDKAEDRRQAKLLSGLLLLTILAVLAEQVVGGNVPIWFLFVLLGGYAISRTTYFSVAAVTIILLLSLPSFLVVFSLEEPTSIRLMAAMIWLIVPILLSSVFLSEVKTAVIIGINMVGILLLPFLNPAITWSMIWGVFGFVATTGMIVLLVMHQRKTNQEAIFMAELEANNAALQKEIVAREQTEAALRQSEEASRQFQEKLIALQEVSIELTQIESFDELCQRAVELGHERLHFDRLGIWFFEGGDLTTMIGSYGIDEQGRVRDERHMRLPTNPSDLFDEGKSSIDMKIKSWRRNVLYDDKNEVVGEGWNVVALLWHNDQPIGFVSADNLLDKRPFSPEILELLGLFATSLSQLIVRKYEEINAQQRRDMLEKVVEMGKEVTQVADFHDCLQRIYQSVKNGLDFDRVGLFLYDEEAHVLQGTYGTDREGNPRDEWDIKLSPDALSPSGKPLHMADKVVFAPNFEAAYGSGIEELEEEMADVKQHVRVVSWLGEKPIAVINADNLVTQRPIDEAQIEALQLFVGYAGLAIENARLLTQVKEAELRYRAIFENAIEGIFQTAIEGYFLRANPAVAYMLGFDSPEQLIANVTDTGQLYVDVAQREVMRQKLRAEQQIQNFEIQMKRSDGSLAWLSLNVQLVFDDEGNHLYYEGTAQDVTHRRHVEEERERLIQELEKRNEELERFTYTVSHDLKSPLITIQGFLGFVERDAYAGNFDNLKADMERITQATQRMRQLLDELLELSRVGRLVSPSEAVLFADLVEDALALVSGRLMQNAVQVNIEKNMPAVFVDRRRLVEVLQNLLDNAAKFTGEKPSPRIDIGTKVDGAETIFFVRDNGVGIPLEYQETVFGLFERLDQSVEGTGIGLALVKRIIEVHNGRLWLESEGDGQGTTFYFTLPLADQKNGSDIL